jgi:hypothetical protein
LVTSLVSAYFGLDKRECECLEYLYLFMLFMEIIDSHLYCVKFLFRALKDLSVQLNSIAKAPEDDGLKIKVDIHSAQISTQINRLKVLKVGVYIYSEMLEIKPHYCLWQYSSTINCSIPLKFAII